MKHVTYADKSVLVGDEAADTLTEYAALLARHESADTVTLHAYGADSDDVDATFVLDAGTILMSETTHSSIPEPDNSDEIMRMREQMLRLSSPNPVQPDDTTMPGHYDGLGLD
jgi:hypothetical protein